MKVPIPLRDAHVQRFTRTGGLFCPVLSYYWSSLALSALP